jgi:hypothetical protein
MATAPTNGAPGTVLPTQENTYPQYGVGAGYTVAQLQNANLNAQITIMATNNGVNWSEWSDPVANSLPGHQYAVP